VEVQIKASAAVYCLWEFPRPSIVPEVTWGLQPSLRLEERHKYGYGRDKRGGGTVDKVRIY
jgi:hypothetical protein